MSQLASAGDATAPLPSEGMRCAGPCGLGGVQDGVLWLVDGRGQPFAVPLDHAGLRARISAAEGDLKAARAIADAGGSPSGSRPSGSRLSGSRLSGSRLSGTSASAA